GYICDFFIRNFNIAGCGASKKNIPTQIFISPESVKFAFVSGLLDGDGSVHKTRATVHYGSVSEKLIDQIQLLLQQSGIFSIKTQKKQQKKARFIEEKQIHSRLQFYNLEICGINAKNLCSKITLQGQEKSIRTLQMQRRKLKKSKFEIIPHIGDRVFSELSKTHIGGGWYLSESGEKFRAGVKYETGCKIRYSKNLKEKYLRKSQIIKWGIKEKLEKIKSPIYEFLEHVIKNDIYFMQVAKITKEAPQATYDIQVEKEHEFIANGMVAHNCLGKYHPHGDSAVYDSLVRMVQDFSLRYPLVDGQGNFGSVDGDAPAAMRYTEARLQKITGLMLQDLEKNTVKFVPNFDNSLKEPSVLPAVLPNLILNGSSGIAVGMATNIPPHNLREVADGIMYLIDHPECEIKDLMKKIKGPDFPTGGIICGKAGIKSAYETGRGRLLVHAKAFVETQKNGKDKIVITEIPYQVNKNNLILSIASLVQDKKIEGISDLRDESDKDGMRIVVELKRGQNDQVVLNQLYKRTQMQTTYGVIMLALVDNRPKVLTLKEMLTHYIAHRKDVIISRTKFDKEKAEARAHILEGLKIALKNLDKIIKLIKNSKDPKEAKKELMEKIKLSEKQAQAILEMQLQRLTNLEREKIDNEYKELIKKMAELAAILASEKKVLEIIKEELLEVNKKFGDERRTQLMAEVEEVEMEDLIQEEDVVITISHSGYIKRLPITAYKKQKRGGKGVSGAGMNEEDFVEDLFVASTHENILFFSDKGKAYIIKVYDIPQAGRTSKGKAIINMLGIASGEKITSSIPVKKFEEGKFLMMVTELGKVKKTSLSEFANIRKSGIIAISLAKEDSLIEAQLTSGKDEIFIATKEGKAIRFLESDIRDMGRGASGVRGINLGKKDNVIGMEIVSDKKTTLLSVTENGFSKRTEAQEYRIQSRGGKGIINLKVTQKNGLVVGLHTASDRDELMIITEKGMVVRCAVKDIRATGRSAQGVRTIKLDKGDKVASVAKIVEEEEEQAPIV
ncbi:MAG: DNA gyrase subunit A, partial [Candidatus Omnitrophota bacterium]